MTGESSAIDRKVKRLESLLGTAKMLNSTLNTDYILNTLIEETLRLIDAGDAAILFLMNHNTGFLEVRSYKGFDADVKYARIKPGESMTGITYASKKPMLFQTAAEIQNALSTMTKESREHIDRVLSKIPTKLKSSMCCPLIYRDECIGVIVVDNFSRDCLFTEDDLELLQAISAQATTAIMNAINHQKDMETMKRMEKYNRIIKEQHKRYKHSAITHSRLTNMVLKGCTLQEIITEVSSLIGKPVVIYDAFMNIKACSSGFESQIQHLIIDRNLFKCKADNTVPWDYSDTKTGIQMVINPVVVSNDILGWMGIINEKLPYKDLEKITIDRGKTIIALEFLKENGIQEIEQRLKGDFLENLLADQNRDYVKRCAEKYGYESSGVYCVVVLELREKDYVNDRPEAFTRQYFIKRKNAMTIVSNAINRYFAGSIVIHRDNRIIGLIKLSNGKSIKPVKDKIEGMLDEAASEMSAYYANFILSAGAGRQFNDLFDLKLSYDEAIKALQVLLRTQAKKRVLFFDDLEIKRFLFNNDPAELAGFVKNILGGLISYENSSRDEFLNTLRQYIRSNGNWSETRDMLHIHGNTLNYRLKRIKDILGLDINDYADRFKIQVAFEILDLIDI